jgi:ABC-2 type transport system permease protein
VFAYAITGAGNFLLRALEREISADVLEVIMTTVTPAQFIGGKLLGISLLILLQSGTFLLAGVLVVERTDFSQLAGLSPGLLLMAFPFLLLGYLGFSAVVMSISAAFPYARENATIMAVVRLGALAPVAGVLFIIPNPQDLPALILSLIPFSSPLLMSFRLLIMPVPVWQWAVSLLLLLGWTGFLLWLSMRIFQANMLLVGGFGVEKLRSLWRG